jgi:hypothetical protein
MLPPPKLIPADPPAMHAMTDVIDSAQNAIDRIIWALYSRPRAVPAYVDVLAVAETLKANGDLAAPGRTGYYVLDQHVPEARMRFDDGLVTADDVGEKRLVQLAGGDPASAKERLLWRWRWMEQALRSPVAYELPAYRIGPIRARTGERAYWLATIDGGLDGYLGIDLFGFACSVEEVFARFRATVLAATLPPQTDASCDC